MNPVAREREAVMKARILLDSFGLVSLVTEGSETTGPVGASDVILHGGVTLWVDPSDRMRVPAISVAPLEPQAEATLRELVGADAAARLVAAADAAIWETPLDLSAFTLELDDAVIDDFSRLGFLLWLEQYTELPLNQDDLDIEIGTIATRLGVYGAWELADERLSRSYSRIIALSRSHAAASKGEDSTQIRRNLADALDALDANAALELSDSETAEVRALSHELSTGGGKSNVLAFVRREHFALAASGQGETMATGLRYSIDTGRVPRNFLDTDEDSILAEWSTSEQLLRVTVPAASTADRASGSLMFAVIDAHARRTAAGPLDYVRDADGARYSGHCRLESQLGPGERVDVYSVLSEAGPVAGVAWTRLRGSREAARALHAERLALASEAGAFNDAARRWDLAAVAFEEASATGNNPEAGADAERGARCAARAAVLWLLRDDEREARRSQLHDLSLAELLYLSATNR